MKNRISMIKLVNEGLCSSKAAAQSLEMSQRQVQRSARKLKESNVSELLPKPRNNWNKSNIFLCGVFHTAKKRNSTSEK